VILQVLGWLVLADAIAAALFALAVYLAGRRSGQPVGPGKSIGLAGCLTVPAVLLYAVVLMWMRLIDP